MSKSYKSDKVETIDDFLARGGKINRVPTAAKEPQVEVIRKTVSGTPAVFLSLEEADLYHGEARKGAKQKKQKPSLKIDLNVLPPALKAKFIAKLKEDADGQGYEEEFEKIEDEENNDDED